MLLEGRRRHRIAAVLNVAYADGLLSERTLAHRLDLLFGSSVIDPARLIGDLTIRRSGRSLPDTLARVVARVRSLHRPADTEACDLLALDWAGGVDELLVGRDESCDVVLSDPTVSRRHLRLRFRDGSWILQDLRSTNGTLVNGRSVIRCQLRPGDQLLVGEHRLVVD